MRVSARRGWRIPNVHASVYRFEGQVIVSGPAVVDRDSVVIITRGEGVRVFDEQGRPYIEAASGMSLGRFVASSLFLGTQTRPSLRSDSLIRVSFDW